MKLKNLLNIVFLSILASFLVLDPLLHKGIFQAHDMPSNLINFGGFYAALLEGNIVPRWLGNIGNLYGSPTMIFYYPLSYYLASIIRLFGFSLIDTTKIFILITFIASVVITYIWLKKHTSPIAAMGGALLFGYAPYRITDIYARGSIAENTAFMFIPFIAYQIYLLCEKPNIRKLIFLSITISALILSHLFLVIIFAPFFILYLFYLKPNISRIIILLVSIFLTINLTAFYTIPLLLESKYTHYDISPFNGSGYATQFLNIKQMLLPNWTFIDMYGNKEYQTYQIGLLQIVILLVSLPIIFLFNKHFLVTKNIRKLYILGLFSLILSIFLMLPISNFLYKIITPLQKIVFPWRFLSLTVFSFCIITSCMINSLIYRLQRIILFLIILIGLILYIPHAMGHNYQTYTDEHYLYDISITTDGFVTLPKWAAQPDIYPKVSDRYQIITGEAVLTPLLKTSTKHLYNINAKVDTRIADSTFYFPGWKVFLDKKPVNIEFQDPNYRGIITFNVPKGEHYLEVVFQNTRLRLVADTISLLTAFVLLITYIYAPKIQKNFNHHSGL